VNAAPPQSLLELYETSVSRHGSRPLFLTKRDGRWVETSYAAFARMVDRMRGRLTDLGIGAGDRVGIISGNRIEWAALAYACYGLRAALVPMYESQLETDWQFVVRDAAVKLLFVSSPALHRRVAGLPDAIPTLGRVCLLDDPNPGNPPTVAPGQRPTPDDVAAVMYTSGTTGEPKGVVLTHGNIVSNVSTVLAVIPVAEHHRTLSFLPWAHAFGHTLELHGVIAAGASMAIAESVDKIVDNLAEVRPTVLVAVPRVFLRVYAGVTKLLAAKPRPIRWLAERGLALAKRRSAGTRLSWRERLIWRFADRLVFARVRQRVGGRLQFAISGAAALPKQVAELVDGLGIEVYEGYGLTETSPIVSANIPGQRKLGSVGRPLPGVRVAIDNTVTGESDHGEIVVHGPNVMRGYHDRPAENRAVFTGDGGLRTGDLGRVDEDGYLYITGRIKEQYKLANGKYVSPAALEERLKLSPFIADVMVYGEDRIHNVALVVPDAEALGRDPRVRETIATEIEALSREFRHYERIAAFALLPEGFTQQNGMLTPSLKLKRRHIVARWRREIEALYASEWRNP
jgi:long-chain acyl-CoA synthetase